MQNAQNDERYLEIAKALFQSQDAYYRFISLDMRNRQLAIQNAYFWVASAMFTVFGTAFHGLFLEENFIHLSLLSFGLETEEYFFLHKLTAFCAFAGCVAAVGLGIDGMRGRENVKRPFGSSCHEEMLRSILRMDKNFSTTSGFDWLMEIQRKSIDHNAKESERMGKRLRLTSRILTISFTCGVLAFLM